ncbi:MAG TPA: hypothetical protein PKM43_05180, partial [Verrucomicrobiota bacterium]|nr:hypothetical protein [Verrucomicrobiota bacterium]
GGNFDSIAYGVSADGAVIAGCGSSSNASLGVAEAFRWTADTGMVALGDFPGGYFNSIAYGISADGLVILGRGESGVEDPFRWTVESGLFHLGFLPCDTWSTAFAASANGAVIVGDPNQNRDDCAFIWDAQHGIRNLHAVLGGDYGLDLTGWQLSAARGISADGNTIVGFGINPAGQWEAWIATGLKPALTIRKTNDTCWVSWPSWASDFMPQSSDDLVSGWSHVVASVITNGNSVSVTQDLSGSTRFYRLVR